MAVTNGYADGDDVQAFLNALGGPGITLGAGSVPTLAQAEQWLDQVAAEVDAVLAGQLYTTVPATGTNDVLLIGRFVAQQVACMVWKAGYMTDELPEKVKVWCEGYTTFIERLMDGSMRLVDQAPQARHGTILAAVYIED